MAAYIPIEQESGTSRGRVHPHNGYYAGDFSSPVGHQSNDHPHPDTGSSKGREVNARNAMAANATLHCLTGCAIGEITGLMIGTALGLGDRWTIALAVGLAFLFGYALSTLPLIKAGLGFFAALSVVFAADTLSIATMEVVDNLVMAAIPGAMDAGLVNPMFWIGMMIALTAAFIAAFPVNRYLIDKGKGHALTHQFHHGPGHESGGPGHRPRPSTPATSSTDRRSS